MDCDDCEWLVAVRTSVVSPSDLGRLCVCNQVDAKCFAIFSKGYDANGIHICPESYRSSWRGLNHHPRFS